MTEMERYTVRSLWPGYLAAIICGTLIGMWLGY